MSTGNRVPVPPVRRPRDVLLDPTPAPPAEDGEDVKTSIYLTRQLMDDLEDRRSRLRRAGTRNMTASRLIRAALRMAATDQAEWDRIAQEGDS